MSFFYRFTWYFFQIELFHLEKSSCIMGRSLEIKTRRRKTIKPIWNFNWKIMLFNYFKYYVGILMKLLDFCLKKNVCEGILNIWVIKCGLTNSQLFNWIIDGLILKFLPFDYNRQLYRFNEQQSIIILSKSLN